MLEGWFCRSRKKLKIRKEANTSKEIKENASLKGRDEHTLHPSGHQTDGQNEIDKPFVASSNFASLLSAAKSELGANSRRSSPHFHDSKLPGTAALDQPVQDSKFSGEDESMIQGSQYPSHSQMPPSYVDNQGYASRRKLGPREQAILSSFQSLQSVEIHDRASRRASPVEHTSHQQQGNQPVPSAEYSTYEQSQGHHATTNYSSNNHSQEQQQDNYPTYETSQGHQHEQSQGHQATTNYSSNNHSQEQEHANYPTYENSQGHQQAPHAEYPSYQHFQGQHHTHSDYSSYQHTQSQHGAPPEYSSYQHTQGQQQAPSTDYSSYQYSQGRQGSTHQDYSSQQHTHGQVQAPSADHSSHGGGYAYSYHGSDPSTHEAPHPNGSNMHGNDFHSRHTSYGQHQSSTYHH